jgi:hypothetical protein
MPHHQAPETPIMQMERALSTYEAWLTNTMGGAVTGSGTAILSEVAELQRHAFCDANSALGAILILHSEIADLVLQHRLTVLRSGEGGMLGMPEALQLAAGQRTALRSMRRVCFGRIEAMQGPRPNRAEHSTASDSKEGRSSPPAARQ